MFKRIVFGFLLLSLYSCTLIPCTFNADLSHLKKKLTEDKMIGTFVIDSKSIERITGESLIDTQLIFSQDGKLKFKNVPREYTYSVFDEIDYGPSGEGEWSIVKDENQIGLTFGKIHTIWKVYEKNNRLVLTSFYGDPDNCLYVRFISKNK